LSGQCALHSSVKNVRIAKRADSDFFLRGLIMMVLAFAKTMCEVELRAILWHRVFAQETKSFFAAEGLGAFFFYLEKS